MNLEPISPQEAVELYLDDRADELRRSSRRSIQSGLEIFVEWTESQNITNMNEISGRELRRFKAWRKDRNNISLVSLNGTLSILRRFLVFCVQIEGVEEQIPDKVPLPNVPEDEEISSTKPSDELVELVREYHGQFNYAAREHIEFELIAETGMRLGAVRSIDLQDYRPEDRVIYLRDRVEGEEDYGTPLKNKKNGERVLNLTPDLCDMIDAYIGSVREDVTDEFGRDPLLTTSHGRVAIDTIRRDIYKMTRPCEMSGSCPHDTTMEECEATRNHDASKCESSHSTHPLRRWSIEHQLDQNIPKEVLSDRVDVSVPVLNKHYDQRTEERKAQQRREVLKEQIPDYRESQDGDTDNSDGLPEGMGWVAHPGLLPLYFVYGIGRWTANRLENEMSHMAAPSPDSPLPSQQKAVKGIMVYCLMTLLLAGNLALAGVRVPAVL